MISDAARNDRQDMSKKEELQRAERNVKEVWGLTSGPSMAYSPPAAQEYFTSALQQGSIKPLGGFKGFQGRNYVVVDDDITVMVDR
ncbi:FAD/NAD(P)-binding domain-containing protein [Paramyrothecium foliicola]|nr:FAD/NAD(P)-binding domain-containing protein [Paramyrothecium foliicola]